MNAYYQERVLLEDRLNNKWHTVYSLLKDQQYAWAYKNLENAVSKETR